MPWIRNNTTEGRPFRVSAKVRVEIAIQGDAGTPVEPRTVEDFGVVGSVHPDFGDMGRVESALAKKGRRTRRETLIQEKTRHATSSSTDAAA